MFAQIEWSASAYVFLISHATTLVIESNFPLVAAERFPTRVSYLSERKGNDNKKARHVTKRYQVEQRKMFELISHSRFEIPNETPATELPNKYPRYLLRNAKSIAWKKFPTLSRTHAHRERERDKSINLRVPFYNDDLYFTNYERCRG